MLTRIKLLVFFAMTCVFALCAGLHAQGPATPGSEAVHHENLWNNYRIEQEIRQFHEQPSGTTISSPQLPPPLLDDKSDEKVFQLNEVVFDQLPRSISKHELDAIADRYIAMGQVSLRDLYTILTEIDVLFDARHVVGRAVLPVQDVENGVLHIQIVEGRVGRVTVAHKRQPLPIFERQNELVSIRRPFADRFVRKNFYFPQGSVLNTKTLEEEILKFNRKYRTQLLAELEPGEMLGSSNLKLTALAPQPVSGGYYVDNSGRESSGKIRNGAFVQLQDILGADESFFASYDETAGTSYLTMFGEAPVTSFGTSLEMSYDYGAPQTIYGPFADLNITGTSRRYRPGVRQLIFNSENRKTDLSLLVENYESHTWFDGFLNYHEKLTGYTIGLSDLYRTKYSVQYFSFGWQLGNSGYMTGNLPPDDYRYDHFHILQSSWTKIWYPNKCWTFLAKANGQWALTPLTQSRIFQIGGMATVRGIAEGLMTGDSGYYLNFEGRRHLFDVGNKGRIEAFGFFDQGGVFHRDQPVSTSPSDFLFSIGAGLNMTWSRYVTATVGYGEPLFTAESHKDEYREKLRHGNAYFTVRVQY